MKKSKKKKNSEFPTLLITGFGSFDEFDANPSGDIAEALNGEIFSNIQIRGVRIPVTWKNSWELIEQQVKEHNPIALLSLGLAPEACMRLEINANNQIASLLDVKGQLPTNMPSPYIIEKAPFFYPSSLPLNWIYNEYQQDLNHHRPESVLIPIRFSKDAGKYLCNYIFYHVMHSLIGKVPYRGFMHVPAYDMHFEGGVTTKEEIFSSIQFIINKLLDWLVNREKNDLLV